MSDWQNPFLGYSFPQGSLLFALRSCVCRLLEFRWCLFIEALCRIGLLRQQTHFFVLIMSDHKFRLLI